MVNLSRVGVVLLVCVMCSSCARVETTRTKVGEEQISRNGVGTPYMLTENHDAAGVEGSVSADREEGRVEESAGLRAARSSSSQSFTHCVQQFDVEVEDIYEVESEKIRIIPDILIGTLWAGAGALAFAYALSDKSADSNPAGAWIMGSVALAVGGVHFGNAAVVGMQDIPASSTERERRVERKLDEATGCD